MIDKSTMEGPARARETMPHRAGRVLLAEDDLEMRRLLAAALRRDRYEVTEVGDGRELIDRLSEAILTEHAFDCIVTDVRMPHVSGTQALKFIHGAGLRIPVIVITAFGDHATRVDAWLCGASAVLDKPFEVEQLIQEVHRLEFHPDPRHRLSPPGTN
jgi:DNA-binding NtrC family response regulator